MKRAYVDVEEGQIHYLTEGSGEPLLLLHQTPLSSDEYFLMVPILAKEYRVIAMDTPGYGNSDRAPRKYSIEDYARAVVGFLDALAIGKASIVGHHTGASIAVEVAATYPERVDKLILSGCPYYEDGVGATLLRDERFQPMEIKEDGSHLTKMWRIAKSHAPESKPEVRHKVVANNLKAGEDAEDGHHAAFRYQTQRRLPLIKCPTLVVSGSKDVFYKRVEVIKNLIPRSRIKIIEGGGVYIGYEMPGKFAKGILEFLRNPEDRPESVKV